MLGVADRIRLGTARKYVTKPLEKGGFDEQNSEKHERRGLRGEKINTFSLNIVFSEF